MSVLDGLLVVEIGPSPAGRFAARILADYGARVLRLSLPDDRDGLSEPESVYAGAESLYLDAGKECVAVDLAAPDASEVLRDAFGRAGVVIETLSPGRLAALGVDVLNALERRPDLVVASISPYGRDGPRAGWSASELTLQAAGGFLTLSGDPRREPVQAALDQVMLTGGRVAAFALLAALLGLPSDAAGRWIDVALVEVVGTLPPFHIQQYTHTGAIPGRGPEREPPLDGQHVATRDGHVTFATGSSPFELFSALFEEPALVDSRFHTPAGRAAHHEELEQLVGRQAGNMTARELFERALALGIVAGIVQTPEGLLDCPQLAARGAFRPLSVGGRVLRLPGLGIHSPDFIERRLEEQRDGSTLPETVASGARGTVATDALLREAGDARRPLAGVTVLSFEDVIALPWATAQLARLGATVIRVESRARIQGRHWGVFPDNQPGEAYWNEGGNFCSLYRNKQSLTLDLADRRAVAIALDLAGHADIVVENFRPGVLARLGLDTAALRARNPSLVIVHCSGYGADGPYARMGAFARTIDAMSGLSDLTGYPDGPPVRANPSYMDMVSAWNISIACLLGLHARRRTGRGVEIEHSMYEAGVSTVGAAVLAAQLGAPLPRRRGNRHVRHAPQGVYTCEDGRFIAITVEGDEAWLRFARLADQAWDRDTRFASRQARITNHTDLDTLIACWTATYDAFALEGELQNAGIAASVVRDARDLVLDKQLRARRFFEWIQTPTARLRYIRPYPGSPFRFSGEGVRVGSAAAMGADNEPVLAGVLGLDAAALRELEELGVIGDAPVRGAADPPRPLDIAAAFQRGALSAHDPLYNAVVADLYSEVGS